jgi:hypothetical protein
MWHIWHITVGVWDWLKANEWLAIWLEGIALVLIFVWDRIDARGEHQERMEQLEITKQQAEAAKLAAQSVMNSERAWVTAELEWAGDKGRIIVSDTQIPPNSMATTTFAAFALELRNDGRTPAWIELVAAGMEISGNQKQPELPAMEYIEPLGAGKTHRLNLTVSCPGQPKTAESLGLHITISYRDIFQHQVMTLEFSVDPLTQTIRRFEQVKVNFIS